MRAILLLAVVPAALVLVLNAATTFAEPPADPIEAELVKLGEEYGRLDEAWSKLRRVRPPEYSNEKFSDEEWRNRPATAGPSPDQRMLPKFLEFAQQHAGSPHALDALFFVVRRRGATANPVGPTAQLANKAVQLAAKDYLNDPRLPALLAHLGGQFASPATDELLLKAATESKHPGTRAAALRARARNLHTFAVHQRMADALETKERLTDFERTLKVYLTPYLRSLPYDADQNRAAMDRALAEVLQVYRDVPAANWMYVGPAKVLLREDTTAGQETNGELAEALRFEIEHLAPGGVAPEIAGRDAEGSEFRLSDFRGKVVLLTFSADWCGPCRKLYPLQRALVEKFKDAPFALVSVAMDEDVKTLRKSLDSGNITWRCWWDGLDGPIYKAWNSPGAGKIVLIDADGVIQDARLHGGISAAEFEAAIERLLK